MAASNVRDWLKNVELYIGDDSEDDADNYIDDGEDLDIPSYEANSGGVVDIVFTAPDLNDNVDIHDVVAPDGSNAYVVVVVDEINKTLWKDGDVEFLPLSPFTGNPGLNVQIPESVFNTRSYRLFSQRNKQVCRIIFNSSQRSLRLIIVHGQQMELIMIK